MVDKVKAFAKKNWKWLAMIAVVVVAAAVFGGDVSVVAE